MEFKPMHKYAVFVLAVIACTHLVFSVNGRQMKSVIIGNNDSKQTSKIDDYAMHNADHRQPNAEEVLSPSIPVKSSGFGDSVTGFKDYFRPTTPGNGPGIGHSFEEDDDEDNQEKPGSFSSINGKHSQDFKRTSPGHSPGVGHVFLSKNSEKTV